MTGDAVGDKSKNKVISTHKGQDFEESLLNMTSTGRLKTEEREGHR